MHFNILMEEKHGPKARGSQLRASRPGRNLRRVRVRRWTLRNLRRLCWNLYMGNI